MIERLRAAWLGIRLAIRAGSWRVPVILACSLAVALQPVVNAVALRTLVDGALAQDWVRTGTGLAILALLVGVVFSAYGIWVPLETTVTERARRLFEQDLMRLVVSIPSLEPHERPDFADKLEVLRSNSQLLIGAVWTAISNVSFFVGAGAALVVLADLHLIMLLLPLFGVPLFIASIRGVRINDQAVEQTAEPLRLSDHLFKTTTTPSFGKELRIFGLSPELIRRQRDTYASANQVLFRADLRSALLNAGGWLVFLAAWAGAIILVTAQARAGNATPGDVVLAIALAGLVQGYVSGAVGLVRDVRRTLTMAARYVWLLDFARSFRPGSRPAPTGLRDGIEFDHVSFTYPGTDVEVLHDVSVKLPAGATVGAVGDNGAGKTTFVKLLLGYYRPTRGRILVDGVDMSDIDLADWRRRCTGAFQDYARLEFRLGESIGVGDLDRVDDPDAVHRAIERAGASELPPLEQQLGRAWDSGTDLSGGQWQQVAVSRGMMRDRPLLRVLDEPTASLDADVEHSLFERYRSVARPDALAVGGITVLVSHRFSTVRMTDGILVFDNGRVVEQGTHDELVRHAGLYAELFALQARAYR